MGFLEAVERLASRAAATEADIQADVRSVLLDGNFDLGKHDLVVMEFVREKAHR